MKLAEALQERADLNRKISQLRVRLVNNALVQEGSEPAEDPKELLVELDSSIERLRWLVAAINHTNCRTVIDGQSLTQIIAQKDALTTQVSAYRDLIDHASAKVDRYMRSDIRVMSTVDVRELQKKADGLSKRIRELDNKLQECNWTTDLLDLT